MNPLRVTDWPSLQHIEHRPQSYCNSTILKIFLVISGILLVGGAVAAYIHQVNAIATYAMGGTGGFCILTTAILSVVQSIRRRQLERQEDAQQQSRWIESARRGELQPIHEALEQNRDTPKEQLLLIAASYGHSELVSELLANGANLQHTDNQGYSLLHLAVKCCDHQKGLATMQVLLERDPSLVSAKSIERGLTPLHLAASYSSAKDEDIHKKKVELLIQNGADVNAEDNQRNTPLHSAISKLREFDPSLEVVEVLIRNGARGDASNLEGHTPLQLAQRYQSEWYKNSDMQNQFSALIKQSQHIE